MEPNASPYCSLTLLPGVTIRPSRFRFYRFIFYLLNENFSHPFWWQLGRFICSQDLSCIFQKCIRYYQDALAPVELDWSLSATPLAWLVFSWSVTDFFCCSAGALSIFCCMTSGCPLTELFWFIYFSVFIFLHLPKGTLLAIGVLSFCCWATDFDCRIRMASIFIDLLLSIWLKVRGPLFFLLRHLRFFLSEVSLQQYEAGLIWFCNCDLIFSKCFYMSCFFHLFFFFLVFDLSLHYWTWPL